MSKLLMFGNAAKDAGYQRRRRSARSFSAWRMAAAFFRHIHFVVLGIVLGVTVSGSGPALSASPSATDVVTVTGFGSRLTIQRPASAAEGDVLVASVAARLSSTASIIPPSGWNLIRRDSNAPQYLSLTQGLYYKVAGASEPARYTWTLASSASAAGAIIDVKGVDGQRPWIRTVARSRREHLFRRAVCHDEHGWRPRSRILWHNFEQGDQIAERDGRALRCAVAESRLGSRKRGGVAPPVRRGPHR